MLRRAALIFLLGMNTCYAKQLTTYSEVLDAAYHGERLTFNIEQNKCNTKNAPTSPNFFSIISQDNFNIKSDGSVFLRDTNPAHELMNYPELGPVTQAYSLELKKDGSVHLVDHILDPAKYTKVLPTVESDCRLGKSVKVYSH